VKANETREIIVGLLAILLFGAVLVWSYGTHGLDAGGSGGQITVSAAFNRVDGLRVGDPAYVSGMPVGRVIAMDLLPDFRANVTLSIRKGVPLSTDTSAAIHTNGLFGGKYVVLDPGGSEELLKQGGEITYTQDALIVSELLDLIIAEGHAARKTPLAEDPSP
jgi:phospholipid/cholesterol/gamma-HCH transport system substrate-binding protein